MREDTHQVQIGPEVQNRGGPEVVEISTPRRAAQNEQAQKKQRGARMSPGAQVIGSKEVSSKKGRSDPAG